MTAVFNNKEFQNYYQNLIDNPQLMENESAIISTMKDQFSKLQNSESSWSTVHTTPLSRNFWEERKGLKNLEKFTALFVQNHHLKASDALELTRSLHDFSSRLNEGEFSNALHYRLDRIGANLMASSTVDRVEGSDISAQVKNNLNLIIEDQQKKLKDENDAFQKKSKRESLIRKISNIGMAFSLPASIISAAFGAIPLTIGFFVFFGISLIGKYVQMPEDKKHAVDLSIKVINEYSRLKDLTDQPQFQEFASDPENHRILANPETTFEAMKLFESSLKMAKN